MKKCRLCNSPINQTFLNLGSSPLSNSYVEPGKKHQEVSYPLIAYRCQNCFLVQLDEFASPNEIFSQYHYFSSFSSSWLEHCKTFCREVINDQALNNKSFVVEIASNDGYLLKNFREFGISVLGIEPAENVAQKAIDEGIPTTIDFFSWSLAKKISRERKADLIIANNVLAHVPNIVDFTRGIKTCLADNGTVSIEFPSLLNLYEETLFDTIYHEHFSYLSLTSVQILFKTLGLRIFKVEHLKTHGGSLRVFACHHSDSRKNQLSVQETLDEEAASRIFQNCQVDEFRSRVDKIKLAFREFLNSLDQKNDKLVAYGAAAKGNTFLNYCGITSADIAYVVDNNPHKQGLLLPGSHIPVFSASKLYEDPDVTHVLVLPWNLKDEISAELKHSIRRPINIVTAIPEILIS